MSSNPVFGALDSAQTIKEITFDSGPVRLDTNVTIANADGTGFKNGRLEISVSDATADDHFGIMAVGGISVSGNQVLYNGIAFGTIVSPGTGGSPLKIDFFDSSAATAARVQLLLRAVTFHNTSDNPPPQARNINFSVTDAEGESTQSQMAVTITPSVAPVFGALDVAKTIKEITFDSGPVQLDTNVTIANADGTGFKNGQLEISVGGATADDHLALAQSEGISVSGNQVLYNGTAFGTIISAGTGGSPLTIDFLNNSAADPRRTCSCCLRAVTLQNTSDNPPPQARNISFSVTDADNETTQTQMAVTITPSVAPVFGALDSAKTIKEVTFEFWPCAAGYECTSRECRRHRL